MRAAISLSVFVVVLVLLPLMASAQDVSCNGGNVSLTAVNPGAVPYMWTSPSVPTSGTPIALNVGSIDFIPMSATAAVSGNSIDVTYTATYFGIDPPPPLTCSSANVGLLLPGTYTVNLLISEPGSGDPTPQLVGTGSFVVAGTGVAMSAPTLGVFSEVALGLLLLVCVRARSSRRENAG